MCGYKQDKYDMKRDPVHSREVIKLMADRRTTRSKRSLCSWCGTVYQWLYGVTTLPQLEEVMSMVNLTNERIDNLQDQLVSYNQMMISISKTLGTSIAKYSVDTEYRYSYWEHVDKHSCSQQI